MLTFILGIIVWQIACWMHGDTPIWYGVLCFAIIDFASVLPNIWMQFEVVSILGVVAMSRDLIRKGIV